MRQKRNPSSLEIWRQVLAEVGILEPPSEHEKKTAAELAEKISLIRSVPKRRREQVNEMTLATSLGDGQKKLTKTLMRMLGRKQVL